MSARRPAADTLEEIEWFLQFGVHPALIANELHRSHLSLAKLCYRYGHNDWAAMFNNSEWKESA